MPLDYEEILSWLREEDPARLEELWACADKVRVENVGDEVHLRGLIEISNHCRRRCGYCGLNAENLKVTRYRMTAEEILGCAVKAADYGYGTVVMQSGEDLALSGEFIAEVVSRIKSETDLAITLSLGERTDDELRLWREAGADRYLLRFETSNRAVYDKIHPPVGSTVSDRFSLLRRLGELGYEVGSGVMIGIPGTTYEDLACDIMKFAELDLDMIGVGPFISHPDTPLGSAAGVEGQVPNTEKMTYKVVALTRLVCPLTNIPSTTALATLNIAEGRELGLQRGANVVMPNMTPVEYRSLYKIYPAKACIKETSEECLACMAGRIRSLGRRPGLGRGDSANKLRRLKQETELR